MKTKIFFLLLSYLSIAFFYSCGSENSPKATTNEEDSLSADTVFEKTPDSSRFEDPIAEPIKDETIRQEEESEAQSIEKELVWSDQSIIINKAQGNEVDISTKGDLLNDSAEEVFIRKEGACGGPDCGKIVHLENLNSEKNIKVLVELNWKENDAKKKIKRSYTVNASESIEIGCSTLCVDGIKSNVKWKIIGANYIL